MSEQLTHSDPPDFFGHAIFCDDIRMEVDGKVTYVGVYATNTMLVRSAFPATLPKFCISIFFNQKAELFKPNLGIRIFLPQDADDVASIQAEFAGQLQGEPLPRVQIMANATFGPFTIEKPGEIRVRILRESVLHRIGTLRVLPHPEATDEASTTA
jgi:hypothetical protein